MAKDDKPKEPLEKNWCEYRLESLQIKFEKDGDITSAKCAVNIGDLNVKWEHKKKFFDEIYAVIDKFKNL